MTGRVGLCWHNKPKHVSLTAGWGWAVNRSSELLAQNKAADEFTVLFLMTQNLQTSKNYRKSYPRFTAEKTPDLLFSLLHSWKCTWAIMIWGLLARAVLSISCYENYSFYLLLMVWLRTLDFKCWCKFPWFVYNHSAFPRDLASSTFSAQTVLHSHILGLQHTVNLAGYVLRSLPEQFVMGILKPNRYKMCCKSLVCNF